MGHAKRFLAVSFLIMIVSLLLYMALSMSSRSVVSYPPQDIFYEDSVTVSQIPDSHGKDGDLLVPVGITVGISFNTRGIMILGLGEVRNREGQSISPGDNKLQAGDVVLAVDGADVLSIAEMIKAIGAGHDKRGLVEMEILRNGKSQKVEISPVVCCDDGIAKIGCWVRDSTRGIGTITFFDPETKVFAALGHGILDVDTKKLLTVRSGHLLEAKIVDIRKGKKGEPGELIGEINENIIIGQITQNTPLGVYGTINPAYVGLPQTAFPIARHAEISAGPAQILSNIEGSGITSYDIFIENINQDKSADKAMVIRITDQGLINRTNGIVQGMSGSPIIQKDKLIGAITHANVQCYQQPFCLIPSCFVAPGR
jgi:stage IV sporulation protein B